MSLNSPRQVRRREKLRALLGPDAGAQAELGREIGTPKSHLSAVLAGKRGIGDALAAKLERHYGKPVGWLDADQRTYWPFSLELQDQVLNLDPEDLHHVEVVIWTHLKKKVPDDLHYPDEYESPNKELARPSTIVSPQTMSRPRTAKTNG